MGPVNINSMMLKLALPYAVESLTYIYNLCIQQNIFPSALKAAKVIPLPKTKDLTDPNTFRPIPLLSILSKPLEKYIHKYLILFIGDHNLFHPFQSGFRRHHSCHTALIRLSLWYMAFCNQQDPGSRRCLPWSKKGIWSSWLLYSSKQIVRLSPKSVDRVFLNILSTRQNTACFSEWAIFYWFTSILRLY